MNTPSSQKGASPRRSDHQYNTTPHPQYVPAVAESPKDSHLEATTNLYEDAGALPLYSDNFHTYVYANDSNQYYEDDLQGQRLQPQQAAIAGSPSARSDHELLHDLANYAQASGPHFQHREASNLPPHHALSPSAVHPSPRSVITESTSRGMSYPPQLTSEQYDQPNHHVAPPRQSRYEPFQNRFHDAVQARDHRRIGTRFDRVPYCNPKTDDTITEVERDRTRNVMRIYNAMTSGEAARDNPGSIAMKRWANDAHYPPDLVEAYAHKVFDCLMQQVKDGFRGWIHNDYVADERKGDDIDKDVDCAGRLENIILALSQEKTICEDVMNSACQIRMFVNAPRAYSNRKHQNRIGNSKRGRTKDTPDPNPRAGKSRRTATGRTRAQSSSMSTMQASRESTPQQPQQQQQQQQQQPQTMQRPSIAPPYYRPPTLQQLSPSPNLSNSYLAPPVTHGLPLPPQRPSIPTPRPSYHQHNSTAMSQLTSSPQSLHIPQSHMPRVTTEPPNLPRMTTEPSQSQSQHHFTFPPPSPFVGFHSASAPASPDEIKPVSAAIGSGISPAFEPHLEMGHASWLPSGAVIDPTLAQWDLLPHTPSADMFVEPPGNYVNMSQIERPNIAGPAHGITIEEFWQMQKDVQDFPSPSPRTTCGSAGEQRGS